MQDTHSFWRTDRPLEGFFPADLASVPDRPVRTFLPDGYEPRYPYPLLIFFHGHSGTDEQAIRLASRASRRNFIAVGLPGPEVVGERSDGRPAYGWLAHDDLLAESVLRAVEQVRRVCHVHSERIYLVGLHEGSAAAYRAAFALGDKIAGVVSLNGSLPRTPGQPLFRMEQVRPLRIMIGHGVANPIVPFANADRDRRLFYACGADVRLNPYPTTHKIHPDMLRDLNRWVMSHVNAEHDRLVRVNRYDREEL